MSQSTAATAPYELPPIPPALISIPRRVRRVGWGHIIGVWAIRLFLLPHTLVGFGVMGAAIGYPIWAQFGHDYTAQVKETRYYTTTSKGKFSMPKNVAKRGT